MKIVAYFLHLQGIDELRLKGSVFLRNNSNTYCITISTFKVLNIFIHILLTGFYVALAKMRNVLSPTQSTVTR